MKVSIQRKLLFSIFFVLFILYTLTCIGIIVYVQDLLTTQTIKNNQEVLERASRQVDTVFRLTDETAKQVIANAALAEIIEEVRKDDQSQQYIQMSRANILLKDYLYLNTFASAIAMITWDDVIYCNQGVFFSDYYKEQIKDEWFQNFINGDEKKIISGVHQAPLSVGIRNVITLAYKFKNIEDYTSDYSYLLIEIPLSVLEDQLISEDSPEQLQIVNDDGQTIIGDLQLTPDILSVQKQHSVRNAFQVKPFMVTTYQSETTGWSFFYLVPLSVFQKPVSTVLSIMAGIFFAVVFITTIILRQILKKMMLPFDRIVASMKKIESGNLEARLVIRTGDEFEILAKGLNDLASELNKHINRLIEEERIQKQMEMDLLMSQIHPHFIYNTLNSAVYLIEEENNKSAIHVIYSLISLLQDTVKIGNKEIFSTIEKEIELLSAYGHIAEVRYPNLFVIDLQCDHTLMQMQIPKVLIQPLVENAIYHGILPAKKQGKVNITIQRDGDWLLIVTEDNGVGINEEKLEKTLQDKSGGLRGVGLSNIRNRLKYLYPDLESSFYVKSKLGEGTRVTIRIPIKPI